jgi:two-component system, chemotaxis family, protein-glutamate methylesterase/glutaminase
MRDIIVLGGSAGSIEPTCNLIQHLPDNLPAALFVVIHIPEQSSQLSQVLKRCGTLTVEPAENGQPIEHGRVYVAPPGHHLLISDGRVELSKGPRENRHRPSIDALFRSAARSHRDRVIAVVLSGALDDGAAGAYAVKLRGGKVVVQDPKEALMPDMPANTLRYVQADHCVPVAKLPAILSKLVREKNGAHPKKARSGDQSKPRQLPVAFVCPECSGPLTATRSGPVLKFRCAVGHSFSPDSLTTAHADALERALWIALRHLTERRSVQETLARQYSQDPVLTRRYEENAEAATQDMALLREVIERL